ncbi:GAF and ANTAR domain-containing protein [Streptomyces sp. NPDC006733]|uniref:GAF and ANTAR domain-containing protein n=1 Tax=Streptomyces sp. NPDC006733 TaxID=3155460 RepID=UPI0033C99ECC
MDPTWEHEAGRTLEEITRRLRDPESLHHTLQQVTDMAVLAVEGAKYAGVTLLGGNGILESSAVTDPLVTACDRLQSELREGPCLQVLSSEPVLTLTDTATEHRWPRFARAAHRLGIGSMLALRLAVDRETLGSLNLHAPHADAFDRESVRVATFCAAQASMTLASTRAAANLRTGMESRQLIGEACGILMARHQLTSEQAFNLLVQASQRRNIKLRTVAAHVVDTGSDPTGCSAPR